MADKESRTEKATPRRRQKYREEGKVATSREVVSLAVLVAGGGALCLVLGRGGAELMHVSQTMLGKLEQLVHGGSTVWIGPVVTAGVLLLLPVALAGTAAALGSGLAQTGGLVTFKSLVPKASFLNPLPKLKEMFFSKQAVISLLQSAGKVMVICAFTFQMFWQELEAMVELGNKPVVAILVHLGSIILRLGLRVVLLLALFAVLDVVLVRRRMDEQMKMSKQELRDEHRNYEGDPEVKRRQKGRQRELSQKRMLGQVAKADVVLVNPTHYAVAVRYDAALMPAPQVTAKGSEEVAARIRDVARSHGVPVVHNPPLARSLYGEVKLGGLVPTRLYGAVAEVLAYVYRLRRGLR